MDGWPIHRAIFASMLGGVLIGLIAFAFLSFYMVRGIVRRSSEDNLRATSGLFVDSISNDVLIGRNPEVYRKCKLLHQSGAVARVEILDSANREVCRFPAELSDGLRAEISVSAPIYFDEHKSEVAATVRIGRGEDEARKILQRTLVVLVSVFFGIALFLGAVARQLSYSIASPIRRLSEILGSPDLMTSAASLRDDCTGFTGEVKVLYRTTASMAERLEALQQERIAQSRVEALAWLAAQVAHDMRSPLAALEVVSGDMTQLPEDKRVLIRAAVGRIRDIANSLLSKQGGQTVSTDPGSPEEASPQLLSSLIDPVVSEKRLQFRSLSRVVIDLRLDATSYGLFATVQPVEFKRLVSNLVNNAVEALNDGAGEVSVGLSFCGGHASVTVRDNGKGIPPEILPKLGRRGETHGKAGGSGLGLYHARSSVESWGGSLEIASEPGQGTITTVVLPLAPAPEWFVPEIRLIPGKVVVILDDDASIHQIWQGRFDALRAGEGGVEIVHVSTPAEIRDWVKVEAEKAGQALYLFDFELLGYQETGLSLAKELELGSRVVLVTSRYEEPGVQEDCRRLKVRLLPKSLAASVPMRVDASAKERFDAVLIDDDPLARLTWKIAADRAGKKLRVFSTAADFLKVSDAFDRTIPIYVDAELANGVKGDVESLRIHEIGFSEIYLATGYESTKFAGLSHLHGVVGKDPPWGGEV